ncbi:phosphate signaling complex PhoU family protein [Demequina litorisediminis]|uniref:PhoU domain-containing protein n=1 Tax=Demequina litorisediminis TaxID=1849022 RepID=A0ABQ6IDG3_9MICO|nr:hypothetical protein GCM10025876_13470 [Demequina litorisediminis]
MRSRSPRCTRARRRSWQAWRKPPRPLPASLVTLLEERDLNTAAGIVSDDDALDSLHSQAYKKLLSAEYDGTVQETLDIALLARFFERFGDHAVAVSRQIVYLVTGDHSGSRSVF